MKKNIIISIILILLLFTTGCSKDYKILVFKTETNDIMYYLDQNDYVFSEVIHLDDEYFRTFGWNNTDSPIKISKMDYDGEKDWDLRIGLNSSINQEKLKIFEFDDTYLVVSYELKKFVYISKTGNLQETIDFPEVFSDYNDYFHVDKYGESVLYEKTQNGIKLITYSLNGEIISEKEFDYYNSVTSVDYNRMLLKSDDKSILVDKNYNILFTFDTKNNITLQHVNKETFLYLEKLPDIMNGYYIVKVINKDKVLYDYNLIAFTTRIEYSKDKVLIAIQEPNYDIYALEFKK